MISVSKKLKLPHKRRHWLAEEDSAIISIVSSMSSEAWTEIGKKLNSEPCLMSRTAKQCRERWTNHLDPKLNKSKWTSQELLDLFTAHSEIGNRWTEIRKYIPHRSENSIKNQFYSCLRKQFRKWKGYEPQFEHIRKHSSKLAAQVLSHLKKDEVKGLTPPKTLADIDPIQHSHEEEEFEQFLDFSPFYYL